MTTGAPTLERRALDRQQLLEADGHVKVVLGVSPRFADLVNAAVTIEESRSGDPAEYGAEVDIGPAGRAWVTTRA